MKTKMRCWNRIAMVLAAIMLAPIAAGQTSSCCSANDQPGCSDDACAAEVCEFMPECCEVRWDTACANIAGYVCGDCEANDEALGCDPCNPFGGCFDKCDCSPGPCNPACPEYDECVCTGTPYCVCHPCDSQCEPECNPACSQFDPCACSPGPCNPDCPEFDPCLCSGTPYCVCHPCDEQCSPECNPACSQFDPCECATGSECGCADAGSCCQANNTAGCADDACCDAVCAINAFCCDTIWDSVCADLAADVSKCGCGPTAPANDNCADAIEVFDGETTYNNVDATTDGLTHQQCNVFGYDNVGSDVWFTYTAICTGTATIDLCGSGYDTKLAVYDGCAAGSCPPSDDALLACNDDACGTLDSQVTIDVEAGNCYTIRVGGYNGDQGDGTLSITCEPVQGACCLDGNCIDLVTQSDCDAIGGTFTGTNSTCAETFNGGKVPSACEADCNENGVPDHQDIAQGVVDDCDFDGQPDSCVPFLPFNGYSLALEDLDDRASINTFSGFPSANLTVSMWVKTSDVTRNSGLFSYAVPGFDNELLLYNQNNVTLYVHNTSIESGVSIADGQWHHIAATSQNIPGHAQLFIDGILVATGATPFGQTFANGGSLMIGEEQDCVRGCLESDQTLIGHVDEVRLWNVARPPNEIQADMETELTGNEDGLVGYWQFSEGKGDLVMDLAGANDAVLPNGGAWLPTGGCPLLGDLDNDGSVGVSDLLQLLSAWGDCDQPNNCTEDLTDDGAVGVSDLLTLLANWS